MNEETDRTALEAIGLGKRYRRGWALRDCSFRIPAGRVCGLVGPNGAGKSTLLALAAYLLAPTEGTITAFGRPLDGPEQRGRLGFVAQDKPLYPRLTVDETLRLGRELNAGWNQTAAQRIVDQGSLPGGARIGTLSGGQRTRVALALALGKQPDLLILDEPMSDLDPLARHQLMGTLMSEAAANGTTILMSSHILSELDGAIDYLLLVDAGRVRLAGEVDEILDAHRLLVGAQSETGGEDPLAGHTVIESRQTGRQRTVLLRPQGPVAGDWESTEPTLEELLLCYLRSPQAPSLFTDSALASRPAAVAA
ncbi:ABC-2 type transport system ATP-binding protein [Kitasatospora sp. MAP12-15]|uniref:ABC transporter ATP-binding protein n=1 Tax=unclassified Kitasatospora TaxID=2633591 RepID=UPI00247494BD|nr:ABC transporter ATP-binding protein [Kitasatospora sp. MAP12-44]MDH6109533.1 ABC-2 type transport system ATP-binding protein [Kitasatospora sp. MAP12-44]